jgi:hypothetical protein
MSMGEDLPGFVSGGGVSSGFVPEGGWEHPLLVASAQWRDRFG